jgi:hypothetical protein
LAVLLGKLPFFTRSWWSDAAGFPRSASCMR